MLVYVCLEFIWRAFGVFVEKKTVSGEVRQVMCPSCCSGNGGWLGCSHRSGCLVVWGGIGSMDSGTCERWPWYGGCWSIKEDDAMGKSGLGE